MRVVLTYLFVIAFQFLTAQVKRDSIYTLPEVEKVESTTNVIRKVTIYSTSPTRNLNDVLRENTGVYIRNYGNGQLSSISFRGTSAAQTDIMWNGVKMNSPSLGQVDASLFNLGMADRVEIKGIAQSGNVGGELNLQNQNSFDSLVSLEATFTYGSFNTFRTFGKAEFSNRRFYGATRISYLNADNVYPFTDTYVPGNPTEKLQHAKVQLLNFMQQFGAKINEHNAVHFSLWLSDAQRQIPPIISKETSKESQDDYSLRSMLYWKGNFGKLNVGFTSAFFHDVIHYSNPEIYLDEKSTMQAFRNNFRLTYDSLKKFSVSAELDYDMERAVVPSYNTIRIRHIAKLTAGVKYQPVKEILLQLNLREQLYDKILSPFSPSLNFSYTKIFQQNTFIAFVNASRNFRFPTLNDLYWVPGGNPNLKTEKSWDGELGARYLYKSNFSIKVVGFCKYVTNWIQWIPNGTYWGPQNVKRVLSRGLEISTSYFYTINQFTIVANANYTYTKATNLEAISPADQSKGKQLIYVPLHVASVNLYFEFRKFYLRAVNTFTNAVFITTDNSQNLKGYNLLDVEAGKDFTIRNFEIGCAFRVNNITGTQYQNVAQRPMPGRNFEGTLRFKFKR